VAAQIERGLDREAAFFLPSDRAPAFAAIFGIDQAAAGNLADDFAGSARRGPQVHGRSDIGGLGQHGRGRDHQDAEAK
jgi:hypothetical protein